MIDLGVELVHYGDERAQQQHGFTLSDLHNMRARSYWAPATKRLADLQAQGFNTVPPPGFTGPRKGVAWLLGLVQDEP
jgi:hypothetical protein